MSLKPITQREAARRDIDDAIGFYLTEANETVALGLIDDLEAAYAQVRQMPQAGSNRYGFELQIEGLKSWPLKPYPYVLFYIEYQGTIEVWRVLHGQRDIPAGLSPPD